MVGGACGSDDGDAAGDGDLCGDGADVAGDPVDEQSVSALEVECAQCPQCGLAGHGQ